MSKLSIIVPVYKVEEWLPSCIDSIFAQSLRDWELLLVDDGSPDGSGAICDAYAARDERIRVIHKANGGVSAARNDALDIATGQYITFVDSDDEITDSETFAAGVTWLDDHPDTPVLQYPVGTSTNLDAPRQQARLISGQTDLIHALDDFTIAGYLWGKIFRVDLFHEIRLPIGMAFAEDTWCLLDIIPNIGSIYLSDKGMYLYNIRSNSAVHSFDTAKCIDFFHMSYKFHGVMRRILNKKDGKLHRRFFHTFQCLLDARVATGDTFDYTGYETVLRHAQPNITALWRGELTRKQRIWLLLFKTIGMHKASEAYVRTALHRQKKTQKS